MTPQRRVLALTVVCFLCAIPREAHAWWTVWRYGGDTHADITKDVLNNLNTEKDPSLDLAADYPDLVRFKASLMTGSNTESHNIPDGVDTEWWLPTEKQIESWFTSRKRNEKDKGWEAGALLVYTNYNFNGAYERIGYELHLVQDQSVPAHQKYCCHGENFLDTDDLEAKANSSHKYEPRSYDHSFKLLLIYGEVVTLQYWLDDAEDDDNKDDIPDVVKVNGVSYDDSLTKDGPTYDWGFTNRLWGTYGCPEIIGTGYGQALAERLPGLDLGVDYFGELGNNHEVVYAQLFEAYNNTLERMKKRSVELPPLIPDDDTNGKPNIAASIFGPNKPVVISFVAMENRKPTVSVFVLAGPAGGIKDNISGKVWDGGANATMDLLPSDTFPWKRNIISNWNGDTATGQINDGIHEISMQIKDQDTHLSEKRTRTVMFDKTKPTGTITINGLSQSSIP
jgi:hypothetical protein